MFDSIDWSNCPKWDMDETATKTQSTKRTIMAYTQLLYLDSQALKIIKVKRTALVRISKTLHWNRVTFK